MTSRIETFSSVRMLANGSFWNGFGRVFSLIIAFVATPVLLHDTSHYSAPLDLVLRLIVVPIAISTAFFPAVATGYRTMPLRSAALLRIGSLTIMLAVWPVCVLIVAFPHQLLTLWLGADFASASRVVLLTLGLGAYLACVSVLPATFTDAIGRPDVGAKILLVQSVLYPSAIIFMIGWYGIEGAAVAWTGTLRPERDRATLGVPQHGPAACSGDPCACVDVGAGDVRLGDLSADRCAGAPPGSDCSHRARYHDAFVRRLAGAI